MDADELKRKKNALYQRKWARNNPEKAKLYQSAWNKKNRNKYQRMYREKKKEPTKDKEIMIRVDESMYLDIRKEALLKGVSVSEYIRGSLKKSYKPYPPPYYDTLIAIENELKEKFDIEFNESYRRGVHENWGGRPIATYDALYKIFIK